MRDFTRDGNKVIYSNSNISKMNVFNYFKYFPKEIFYPLRNFIVSLQELKQMLMTLFYIFANLILIILYPLTLLLMSYLRIKRAKKEVAYRSKMSIFK